jgi:hypothetical protein
MIRRIASCFVPCFVAACCGGSPSSPGGPGESGYNGPSLAGQWVGTWSYSIQGLHVTEEAATLFVQVRANMSGSFTSGTTKVTILLDSSLGGTLSVETTTLGGVSCTAFGVASGILSGNELEVSSASVPGGSCGSGSTEHLIKLRR